VTVRTHLKSTFAKTGTRRQTELVALVLRSVATMSPPT
jgi:DNA-binding CsgD family transcriptional regulator